MECMCVLGQGWESVVDPIFQNKCSLGCFPLRAFTWEGPQLIPEQIAQGEGDITLHSGNGGTGGNSGSLKSPR